MKTCKACKITQYQRQFNPKWLEESLESKDKVLALVFQIICLRHSSWFVSKTDEQWLRTEGRDLMDVAYPEEKVKEVSESKSDPGELKGTLSKEEWGLQRWPSCPEVWLAVVRLLVLKRVLGKGLLATITLLGRLVSMRYTPVGCDLIIVCLPARLTVVRGSSGPLLWRYLLILLFLKSKELQKRVTQESKKLKEME